MRSVALRKGARGYAKMQGVPGLGPLGDSQGGAKVEGFCTVQGILGAWLSENSNLEVKAVKLAPNPSYPIEFKSKFPSSILDFEKTNFVYPLYGGGMRSNKMFTKIASNQWNSRIRVTRKSHISR